MTLVNIASTCANIRSTLDNIEQYSCVTWVVVVVFWLAHRELQRVETVVLHIAFLLLIAFSELDITLLIYRNWMAIIGTTPKAALKAPPWNVYLLLSILNMWIYNLYCIVNAIANHELQRVATAVFHLVPTACGVIWASILGTPKSLLSP